MAFYQPARPGSPGFFPSEAKDAKQQMLLAKLRQAEEDMLRAKLTGFSDAGASKMGFPAPAAAPVARPKPQMAPTPVMSAAGAPGGAVGTPMPNAPSAVAGTDPRRANIEAELEALNQPQDMTAIQGEGRRKGEQGMTGLMMALAAQRAGPSFDPMQQHMLRQAMEGRQGVGYTGGRVNEMGEVIADPSYAVEGKRRLYEGRLAGLDREDAAKAAQAASIAAANQRHRETLEARRYSDDQNRALRGAIAAGKADGGAGGEDASFDTLPKAATSQEKNTYANAAEGLNVLPALMAEAQANPNAFGFGTGMAEKAGGLVGTGMIGKTLTPEEAAVRSRVYLRYGQIVNSLIGAAQTLAEVNRLSAFLPKQNESAESIARKMNGALQEFQAQRDTLRGRYNMGGAAPAGGAAPGAKPAPGGGGGWKVEQVP